MIRSRRSSLFARPGFTLVELLATISVIFLIMGIALVAYTSASRSARAAADRAAVNGLQLAVGQFKAEFGFVPPLVKDDGGANADAPLATVRGRTVPLVYSLGSLDDGEALRGRDPERLRYSILSLPYYILGALDGVIDGVDGLGFYEVRRDGTFAPSLEYETNPELDPDGSATVTPSSRSQRRYDAFFDVGRGGVELFIDTSTRLTGSGGVLTRNRIPFRFELRDRAGVAIRYYRWAPDERPLEQVFREDGIMDISEYTDPLDAGGLEGEAGYYNTPPLVLDAIVDDSTPEFPPALRSATYAVMAAGPNQLFGDETDASMQSTSDAIASDGALRRRYAEQLGLSEARLSSDPDYRDEAIELARADNIVEVGS